MLVPTSSKVVLAGILSQGVGVRIPLYMESQLGGDTITDFGGNDIFRSLLLLVAA